MNSIVKERARFPLIEKRGVKPNNKGTAMLQRRNTGLSKAVASWQKPLTKHAESRTHRKSTFSQCCQRRLRILEKDEKIDASSNESIDLSGKQKIGNVLELRREINEWRRQEELRSNINQVFERSTWTAITTENNKENSKFDDLPMSIGEQNAEESDRKYNPEGKNDMPSGRSRSKIGGRKQGSINIPVTWISVPPDTPVKTSLRNVADYLSEKERDSPLRPQRAKRSLCLSTESLQALENAEKLVEEAGRQLWQLSAKAVLAAAEDFEGSGFVDESSAYIRQLVARSFENGRGAPQPTGVNERLDERLVERLVNAANSTLKFGSATSSSVSSSGCISSRTRATESSKVQRKAAIDDCMLCSGKEKPSIAMKEAAPSEKLTVQRGPAVCIKADLCVQTSRLVDIQPSKDAPRRRTGADSALENVASFEFCHRERFSSCKEKSQIKVETMDAAVATSIDRSSVSSPVPISSERLPAEPGQLDVLDLSLGEPRIIMELDVLLDQQRSIIRKVCRSSQALDQLLLRRETDVASQASSSDRESDDSAESFELGRESSAMPAPLAASGRKSCRESSTAPCVAVNLSSRPKPRKDPSPKVERVLPKKSCRPREEEDRKEATLLLLVDSLVDSLVDNREDNEKAVDVQKETSASVNVCTAKGKVKDADENSNVNRETSEKIEESENSLQKTCDLLDSLSDDLSICKRLSRCQSAVQSTKDNTEPRNILSIGECSTDLERATVAKEQRASNVSSGSHRSAQTASQHEKLTASVIEPEKLSLLRKLESCSIRTRYQYKAQPLTSTVPPVPPCRVFSHVASQSDLSSSLATHSEGELCLSSSASYSLGEVRRKNANDDPSSSTSRSSSTKLLSNSSSCSPVKTPPARCSIGQFVESTK